MNELESKTEFIKNCYTSKCQGRNYKCGYYKQELLVHFDKTKPCSVYKTIQNDIVKREEKLINLTYPHIDFSQLEIEQEKPNINYSCINDLVGK